MIIGKPVLVDGRGLPTSLFMVLNVVVLPDMRMDVKRLQGEYSTSFSDSEDMVR